MPNLTVRKLFELPFVFQLALFFILSLVIIYLTYLVSLSSMQEQTKNLKQQEEDFKTQFKISYMKSLHAKFDLEQIPKLKKLLLSWQNKIITESEYPKLQDAILKLGESNQLKMDDFGPGPISKNDVYKVIPLKITMAGTYDQIASFISNIVNMGKIIVISNFNLAKLEANNSTLSPPMPIGNTMMKAEVNLEVYQK